jgi:hypothetical protein
MPDGGVHGRTARAAAWGAAAWGAAALATFPVWSPDDAYILLRYVDHLARDGRPTWNLGEHPIDGYTGALLPGALAITVRLGGSAYVAAKAIGVLAFAAGGWILWRLLARLRVRADVAAATVAAYATAPEGYIHALSGLETTVFAALVGATALALAAAIEAPSRRADVTFALTALAASLTRPEGVACAVAGAVALAVARRGTRGGAREPLGRFAALYGIPGAAYFVARWTYYGRPLPNTFYAKVAVPSDLHEFGAGVVAFADRQLGGLLCAAMVAVAALALVEPAALGDLVRRRGRPALVLLALVGPSWAVYARSYLAMDYHQRFAFHDVVPVLAAVAVVGSDALDALGRVRERAPLRARAACVFAAAFAVAQVASNAHRRAFAAGWAHNYRALLDHEHARAGDWLREHLPPGSVVASIMDAGVVGYRSGLTIVDFGRLSDAYLAQPGRTTQDAVDYFFARRVDAAVITSYSRERVEYTPEAMAIARDPRFARYRLAQVFATQDPPVPDCELVFVRADRLPEGFR